MNSGRLAKQAVFCTLKARKDLSRYYMSSFEGNWFELGRSTSFCQQERLALKCVTDMDSSEVRTALAAAGLLYWFLFIVCWVFSHTHCDITSFPTVVNVLAVSYKMCVNGK